MFRERLEAVTVCVGYGDFLTHIAPVNSAIFDKWLIVTTEDDEVTRETCRRLSLPTLLTNDGKGDGGDGGEFRKGRMIERGLQHLSADGWRIHLDADIALPSRTRHFLEAAEIEQNKIYGMDRIMVKSFEDWTRLLSEGWLTSGHHDYHNRVRWPKGFEMGSRWASLDVGYVPIGFFQMWHSSTDLWRGARIRPYPSVHNDACRTDVQHGLQWDRQKRALIPELIAVHVESKAAPLGANWKGRQTPWFGPASEKPRYPSMLLGCTPPATTGPKSPS
jgi:hypothetical protein